MYYESIDLGQLWVGFTQVETVEPGLERHGGVCQSVHATAEGGPCRRAKHGTWKDISFRE